VENDRRKVDIVNWRQVAQDMDVWRTASREVLRMVKPLLSICLHGLLRDNFIFPFALALTKCLLSVCIKLSLQL